MYTRFNLKGKTEPESSNLCNGMENTMQTPMGASGISSNAWWLFLWNPLDGLAVSQEPDFSSSMVAGANPPKPSSRAVRVTWSPCCFWFPIVSLPRTWKTESSRLPLMAVYLCTGKHYFWSQNDGMRNVRKRSYPQVICSFLFCAALEASSSCLRWTKSRQSAASAIFTASFETTDQREWGWGGWKNKTATVGPPPK